MSKSSNQKRKILYLMKIFTESTDENHAMSAGQLIEKLGEFGVEAERKSIYRDIEELQLFGMDIVKSKEAGGYYLASREFELTELKLLVDAVQSSKFITLKKSEELIKKLEGLASTYEAKQLQRQVVVRDRIKTMNESIYYNVDYIQGAMQANQKIRYQYYDWTSDKEKKLRKRGAWYTVSPWVLTWADENYYLIAYDGESESVKHYRVDKMVKVEPTGEEREGKECFKDFNVARFAKQTFGMFGGKMQTVIFQCENHFAGIMIDRFGQEVPMRRLDDTYLQVRAEVNVSPQFFGWLAGLGEGVKIISPIEVAEEFKTYLQKILNNYCSE